MGDHNLIKPDDKKLFEIKSTSGKVLRTTKGYWTKIVTIKHPSLFNKQKEIEKVLQSPEIIRVSKSDKKVFLYYRKHKLNYFCAVAKHENGKGFLITAYLTNKIKEGTTIWQKQAKK